MRKTINDKILSNFINKKNIILIINFWSEWCPSCKILKNILNEIKIYFKKKIKIIKINIEYNNYYSEKFFITNVPTIIIMKNKILIKEFKGFIQKENIKILIEKILKNEK